MPSRERFLSERIANLGWKIPVLGTSKKYHLQEWVIRRERERLKILEQQVLQKLHSLHSEQNTRKSSGFGGAMIGFTEALVGEDGSQYSCTVVTDLQRLEVKVIDLPLAESQPIRKYRVFLGKTGTNGATFDLSCIGDKQFSFKSNSSDNDYPEKGLTLKESCKFMEEILYARSESSRPLIS